jgi:hypothetical protein
MIQTAITTAPLRIVSNHGFAEIIENTDNNQKSLHALKPFKKGALLSKFYAGTIQAKPNYLTVQTGVSTHITLMPEFLQYINHSCSPNVFFDTSTMEVRALKNIEINEEFTFFYPSTELDMAQPFICYCGSGNCLQNIMGAKFIKPEILKTYKLTQFIKGQLNIT